MDAETHMPRIPGVGDHVSYLRFLDDRKAFDAYHEQLAEQIKRLGEAIALYGKAKDIERLHAEAADHKMVVLSEIDRREAALKVDRENLAIEKDCRPQGHYGRAEGRQRQEPGKDAGGRRAVARGTREGGGCAGGAGKGA